jgi:SAM-dependent methyltransferase
VTGLIIVILTVSAMLFAAKLLYVFSTVCVLPMTQGALYVSTARCRIDAALDLLPLTSTTRLVDLGCGDGRVLRMARRRGAGQVIGYELNPLAYLKARLLSIRDREITILHRNFWNADLGTADVVCCYLFPDVMARLADKLKRELRPGAIVISFNFPLRGLTTPSKVLRPGSGRHNDPIYLYRLDKEGAA